MFQVSAVGAALEFSWWVHHLPDPQGGMVVESPAVPWAI